MVLLTEAQEDEFLNAAERLEEDLASVDYDVWACLSCEAVSKIRYGAFFSKYSKCKQCGYQTRFDVTTTVKQATEYSGGQKLVKERCKNCDYYHERVYSTPRLQTSSPSSNGFSSGSSGGGFGGGSSGGGFGGGSSSGGGASGGW